MTSSRHHQTRTVLIASLIFSAIVAVILFFAPNTKPSTNQLSIVSTIFPGYDFARAVTKDTSTNLRMLVAPGSDIHDYEPTPQDIITIQSADLFIYVGGESEAWADQILNSMSETERPITVKMLDVVSPVIETITPDMTAAESDSKDYDEHVWTDPKNAIEIIRAITLKLEYIAPNYLKLFRQNSDNYIAELTQLDQDFQTLSSSTKQPTIIVADRFPLRYFTDAYRIEYYAAFPGCAEQTEASADTIAYLIDQIRQRNIHYIFTIELSNQKIAKTIATETDTQILELHSAHNLSKADFDAGKTYLDFMRQNYANLKQAFTDEDVTRD